MKKEGIVNPKVSEGGSRHYSLDDLERARLTRFLTKDKIMNFTGVKILLSVLNKMNIKPENYSNDIQRLLKLSISH